MTTSKQRSAKSKVPLILGGRRGRYSLADKLRLLDEYGTRAVWYVDGSTPEAQGEVPPGHSVHALRGPATSAYPAFDHSDSPDLVQIRGGYCVLRNTPLLLRQFRDSLMSTAAPQRSAPSYGDSHASERAVPVAHRRSTVRSRDVAREPISRRTGLRIEGQERAPITIDRRTLSSAALRKYADALAADLTRGIAAQGMPLETLSVERSFETQDIAQRWTLLSLTDKWRALAHVAGVDLDDPRRTLATSVLCVDAEAPPGYKCRDHTLELPRLPTATSLDLAANSWKVLPVVPIFELDDAWAAKYPDDAAAWRDRACESAPRALFSTVKQLFVLVVWLRKFFPTYARREVEDPISPTLRWLFGMYGHLSFVPFSETGASGAVSIRDKDLKDDVKVFWPIPAIGAMFATLVDAVTTVSSTPSFATAAIIMNLFDPKMVGAIATLSRAAGSQADIVGIAYQRKDMPHSKGEVLTPACLATFPGTAATIKYAIQNVDDETLERLRRSQFSYLLTEGLRAPAPYCFYMMRASSAQKAVGFTGGNVAALMATVAPAVQPKMRQGLILQSNGYLMVPAKPPYSDKMWHDAWWQWVEKYVKVFSSERARDRLYNPDTYKKAVLRYANTKGSGTGSHVVKLLDVTTGETREFTSSASVVFMASHLMDVLYGSDSADPAHPGTAAGGSRLQRGKQRRVIPVNKRDAARVDGVAKAVSDFLEEQKSSSIGEQRDPASVAMLSAQMTDDYHSVSIVLSADFSTMDSSEYRARALHALAYALCLAENRAGVRPPFWDYHGYHGVETMQADGTPFFISGFVQWFVREYILATAAKVYVYKQPTGEIPAIDDGTQSGEPFTMIIHEMYQQLIQTQLMSALRAAGWEDRFNEVRLQGDESMGDDLTQWFSGNITWRGDTKTADMLMTTLKGICDNLGLLLSQKKSYVGASQYLQVDTRAGGMSRPIVVAGTTSENRTTAGQWTALTAMPPSDPITRGVPAGTASSYWCCLCRAIGIPQVIGGKSRLVGPADINMFSSGQMIPVRTPFGWRLQRYPTEPGFPIILYDLFANSGLLPPLSPTVRSVASAMAGFRSRPLEDGFREFKTQIGDALEQFNELERQETDPSRLAFSRAAIAELGKKGITVGMPYGNMFRQERKLFEAMRERHTVKTAVDRSVWGRDSPGYSAINFQVSILNGGYLVGAKVVFYDVIPPPHTEAWDLPAPLFQQAIHEGGCYSSLYNVLQRTGAAIENSKRPLFTDSIIKRLGDTWSAFGSRDILQLVAETGRHSSSIGLMIQAMVGTPPEESLSIASSLLRRIGQDLQVVASDMFAPHRMLDILRIMWMSRARNYFNVSIIDSGGNVAPIPTEPLDNVVFYAMPLIWLAVGPYTATLVLRPDTAARINNLLTLGYMSSAP